MKCKTSKHGSDRMRERMSVNKKSVQRVAENAFERGLHHNETNGSLHRFLDSLYLSHKTARNIRVYNNEIFIFSVERNLITVIDLPSKYQSVVKKMKDRKELEAIAEK